MADPDAPSLPPLTVRRAPLDRKVEAPAPTPAGPSRGDGNPKSNARGQNRALVPTLGYLEAQAAAAEAAEAATAALLANEIAAETAAAPEEAVTGPFGWAAAGFVGVGIAGTAALLAYRMHATAEAKRKVAEAKKKLKDEEDEAKKGGGPDKNVAVEGEKPCPKPLVIQFDLNGYDKSEFDHQLKMQQDKIMQKGACQDYSDIDKFDKKSPATKKADRRAADKVGQVMRESYERQHGLGSADNLAALHRLDMVAGGEPLDLAEMGDKGVNSSIGPQWNGAARKPALKAYAKKICDSKGRCPFSVTLIAK